MKTRVILTLCVVFFLGVVSNANAQVTLVAGSPEDKAFTAAMAETNLDAKIKLLEAFEKQFPNSKVLPDIFNELMGAHRQKNDNTKITEVGERAIKVDPENFMALMAVSRNFAMAKSNLERAVTYAQKAVDVLVKKKTEPRYNEDAAWKQYIDSTETSAKANLTYVRSIRP